MKTLDTKQIKRLHEKLLDATGSLNGIQYEKMLDSALSVNGNIKVSQKGG